MSNQVDYKIVQDGFRNAIVKITGVLDSSNIALVPAVKLADFLNNDTANRRFTGFKVMHVWHSIGDGLEIVLQWNAAIPQTIFALAGRGREDFHQTGGRVPNQLAGGYDGSINLITSGYGVNNPGPVQNFTIDLELVKLYQV